MQVYFHTCFTPAMPAFGTLHHMCEYCPLCSHGLFKIISFLLFLCFLSFYVFESYVILIRESSNFVVKFSLCNYLFSFFKEYIRCLIVSK